MNKAQYKYNKSLTLSIFNFRKSGLDWQLYSENVVILTALFCKVMRGRRAVWYVVPQVPQVIRL